MLLLHGSEHITVHLVKVSYESYVYQCRRIPLVGDGRGYLCMENTIMQVKFVIWRLLSYCDMANYLVDRRTRRKDTTREEGREYIVGSG